MESLLTKADLIQAIKNGRGLDSELGTADSFLKSLQACLNGTGPCDILSGPLMQELGQKLAFSCDKMVVGDFATKGAALTPGSIMDFDAIITATTMDRDKDVLESAGAVLDPMCPFLLFHDPNMPCGKLVSKTQHTRQFLAGRFSICDTELGRDAATLIEFGALRISHGFEPDEYEPLKEGRWHITKFHVLEVSGVPVPSNTSAIITAFSRNKLHSPFVKSFGRKLFESRPAMVQAGISFEEKSPSGFSSIAEFYDATEEMELSAA